MFAVTLSKITYILVVNYINTASYIMLPLQVLNIIYTNIFLTCYTLFSYIFLASVFHGMVMLPYHQEWSCIIIHLKFYSKLCVTLYQLAGYILKLP